MIIKLAIRNLFHDRARLLVTLVGILFAVVLVAVQLGMYFGARRMIVGVIEHANGDLWISAYGTESFEQAPLLTGRERFAALSVPGVEAVKPLIVSFADWRRPDSSATNVVIVGADKGDSVLDPWNIVEGTANFASPDGVAVDRTYAKTLGISGVGQTRDVGGSHVKVEALTDGIRSFTTSPYVFASLNKARSLLNVPQDRSTFYLVTLTPGAKAERVKAELQSRLPDASVATKAEFLQRNLDYWLFGTAPAPRLSAAQFSGLSSVRSSWLKPFIRARKTT